jgi:hypothetical protein
MSDKHLINGVELEVTEEMSNLLKATASDDLAVAQEHREALAQVVRGAWKAGVLEPDLLGDIFSRIALAAGSDAKFPFDFYAPGLEGRFKAIVMPKEGAVPDRVIEGDEIYVPTYKIYSSISWSLDYARDARWDVVARAIEVYTNAFVRKLNDDGWHVILQAASTNSVINDAGASSGVFTKKLLLDMMTGIKRLTGGRNSRLTDLYISPEVLADIRNFDNTALDDLTLRNLLTSGEDVIPSLYGVRLHEMQELGVGQEYQDYLENTIGASLAASDDEFVVGWDGMHRDSFVMPIRETMKMFDDPTLHRKAKAGVYGWMEIGFAALDTRRALLGSL